MSRSNNSCGRGLPNKRGCGYWWWTGDRAKQRGAIRYTQALVDDALMGTDVDLEAFRHDQANKDAISVMYEGLRRDQGEGDEVFFDALQAEVEDKQEILEAMGDTTRAIPEHIFGGGWTGMSIKRYP